uniref:Bm13176 n=1 Tax=Brugia malayi TaxID=6279 RepID=A0A1I9G4Q4_BRUMA|nr:Bm13176 [Brugia malayi]
MNYRLLLCQVCSSFKVMFIRIIFAVRFTHIHLLLCKHRVNKLPLQKIYSSSVLPHQYACRKVIFSYQKDMLLCSRISKKFIL